MEMTMEGNPAKREPLGVGKAILFGWLTVGILDGLDACLFWFFRADATPQRIFQSVAAGFFGREAALAGGPSVAWIGLGVHFLVALTVVAVYVLASRKLPDLVRRPILWGVIYGLAVYCVMYYVVMPLSQIGMPTFPAVIVFLNNILIHIFGIGLPTAYWARRAG
jgi:hypothetical protein